MVLWESIIGNLVLTTELKRKLAVKSLKTDVLRRQKASHQDLSILSADIILYYIYIYLNT